MGSSHVFSEISLISFHDLLRTVVNSPLAIFKTKRTLRVRLATQKYGFSTSALFYGKLKSQDLGSRYQAYRTI